MNGKKIKTPVSDYKKWILIYMRQFWKSQNIDMWCTLYTFIKYYTEDERIKLLTSKEENNDTRAV